MEPGSPITLNGSAPSNRKPMNDLGKATGVTCLCADLMGSCASPLCLCASAVRLLIFFTPSDGIPVVDMRMLPDVELQVPP